MPYTPEPRRNSRWLLPAVDKTLLMIRPAMRSAMGVLFPNSCPLCQLPIPDSQFLCGNCIKALPPMAENFCLLCGTSVESPVTGCGTCLQEYYRPDRTYFPFTYTEPFSRLIIKLKFNDHSEWARKLIDLTMDRVGDSLIWEDLEMVVPIPLHPLRLLWRGYNQSAILAGELAKRLHRPLVTNGLCRTKMTRPQLKLSKEARQRNVQNAFAAKRSVFHDRTVLMVDDVYTTGSTIWSATQTLKKAGAKRVVVCCLARVEH